MASWVVFYIYDQLTVAVCDHVDVLTCAYTSVCDRVCTCARIPQCVTVRALCTRILSVWTCLYVYISVCDYACMRLGWLGGELTGRRRSAV